MRRDAPRHGAPRRRLGAAAERLGERGGGGGGVAVADVERPVERAAGGQAALGIERGERVQFMEDARNLNRSVGAMLSGELIRRRPEGGGGVRTVAASGRRGTPGATHIAAGRTRNDCTYR